MEPEIIKTYQQMLDYWLPKVTEEMHDFYAWMVFLQRDPIGGDFYYLETVVVADGAVFGWGPDPEGLATVVYEWDTMTGREKLEEEFGRMKNALDHPIVDYDAVRADEEENWGVEFMDEGVSEEIQPRRKRKPSFGIWDY